MFTHNFKQNLGKALTILIIFILFFASFAEGRVHASVLDDTFTGISLHNYNNNYVYRSEFNDAILTPGGVTSGDESLSLDVYKTTALTDMQATVYVKDADRITNVVFRTNLSSSGSTFTNSEFQGYGCYLRDDGTLLMSLDNYGSASTLGSVSITPLTTGNHYLTGGASGTTLTCSVDGTTYLTRTDSTIASGSAGFLTQPDIVVTQFIINSL